MKLSAYPNSVHYDADAVGRCEDVLLNGESVRFCHFADEEAGYVIRTKVDECGAPVTKGEHFVFERVTGRVEIVMRKVLEDNPHE